MKKNPPKIQTIDEKKLQRIRARAKGKQTFADLYPSRKATRCLHPGAETVCLNEILPGCKLYFEWICEKNREHLWSGTANNRTRYGCPHCKAEKNAERMRRYKTSPDHLLCKRFPELYAQLLKVVDSRGRELDKANLAAHSHACGIWDIGCGHGPFIARISDRVRGTSTQGCPTCSELLSGARARLTSLEKLGPLRSTHPVLCLEWVAPIGQHEGRKDITPDTVSAASGIKVLWRCSGVSPSGIPCKHEYTATVADRASGNHGCKECARLNSYGQNKRQHAVDKHGSVKDHPLLGQEFRCICNKKHAHLGAENISIESRYSVLWECSLHPGQFFKTSASDRLYTKDGKVFVRGCSLCGEGKKRTWGYTQGIKRSGTVAEVSPELVADWIDCPEAPTQTPQNTSAGSNLNVRWRCSHNPEHEPWIASVANRTNGSGCPKCNSSKGEKATAEILTALGVTYKGQMYVKQLLTLVGLVEYPHSRRFRYDFAILSPAGGIYALVEYHGIQHYLPVNFGSKSRPQKEVLKDFERSCLRDKYKRNLAEKLKIPLLVIPHWEFAKINDLLVTFLNDINYN